MRKRARPDHALLKARWDEELAEADKKLDDELRALFLQYGVTDKRYA